MLRWYPFDESAETAYYQRVLTKRPSPDHASLSDRNCGVSFRLDSSHNGAKRCAISCQRLYQDQFKPHQQKGHHQGPTTSRNEGQGQFTQSPSGCIWGTFAVIEPLPVCIFCHQCIVEEGVTLRGDLAIIRVGRYCFFDSGTALNPCQAVQDG